MQAFREWLSDVTQASPALFAGQVRTNGSFAALEFDPDSLSLRVNGVNIGATGANPRGEAHPDTETPRRPPVSLRTEPAFRILSAPVPPSPRERLAKFFIHVNNVCNLRCTYCYEQDLPYDTIRNHVLPENRVEEVCRFIQASAADAQGVQLTFFGGEPFLSFGKVVSLHSRLETLLGDAPLHLNVVTNGTILSDEQLDYLVKHRFDVMVSFDGTREYNDKQRPGIGGVSTYDRTLANIRRMVAAGVKKVSARITYGQESLDLVRSVRAVAELGVHDLAFRPVMDATPVNRWADWESHRAALHGVAEFYLERLVARRPVVINNVHEIVRRLVLRQPKTDYCEWGRTCSITSDGDIFPCTHFVGMPEFHMGTIREGIDETRRAQFVPATRIENLPCQACSLRHICGGGCRGCSQYVYGDIFREDDYCEARRELFAAVVQGIARLVEEGRWTESHSYIQSLMTEGSKKHSCDRFS
jgi:uncharacterized protein